MTEYELSVLSSLESIETIVTFGVVVLIGIFMFNIFIRWVRK